MTSINSDVEEINTKELAQRISAELKRYSIPQAIFAQRVLCRSQGTLSDLLRNPKPWSKLKSGRETFRRMFKWLQEPEFQRMSALRMAGKKCIMHKMHYFARFHQKSPGWSIDGQKKTERISHIPCRVLYVYTFFVRILHYLSLMLSPFFAFYVHYVHCTEFQRPDYGNEFYSNRP